MGLPDRLARLQDVLDGLLDRQRTSAFEDRGQVRSAQVFHHHVRGAALQLAEVEHSRDVLACQPGSRLRFAQESVRRPLTPKRLRAHHLYRHEVTEHEVPGSQYHPHTAGAEHALDPVLRAYDVTEAYGVVDHGISHASIPE
jgi:hypothetical protein